MQSPENPLISPRLKTLKKQKSMNQANMHLQTLIATAAFLTDAGRKAWLEIAKKLNSEDQKKVIAYFETSTKKLKAIKNVFKRQQKKSEKNIKNRMVKTTQKAKKRIVQEETKSGKLKKLKNEIQK